MNNSMIIKSIDEGANFYCRQLGNASHMEYENNGFYSIIYPKEGQEGGTSLFDVTLDHLSDEEALQVINEIKAMNVHTWWGLSISDRIANLIWGKDRTSMTQEQQENADEFYMALFKDEIVTNHLPDGNDCIHIKKVTTPDEFIVWADICNTVLHDGFPIIHRVNHYEICKAGIMDSYVGYYDNKPVAVTAIMNNNGDSSLEFVATLEEYRKRGLARALCQRSIDDAFTKGAKILTTRTFRDTKKLYQSLGFGTYYL